MVVHQTFKGTPSGPYQHPSKTISSTIYTKPESRQLSWTRQGSSGIQHWEEYKHWTPCEQLAIIQQLPDVEKAPLALVQSMSTIQATYQCTWMDLKQIVDLKAGPPF
ncbi:Hypothetical predicted protein [Pelobates cultripes]|uniref:Uncharacterized protein n=1 Tax=Pelobates cultripes TaxID=61616 RepID=A0AAD1RQ38_PELCU|nr:Hypothetical predicted protein [Pelobates cultripes]